MISGRGSRFDAETEATVVAEGAMMRTFGITADVAAVVDGTGRTSVNKSYDGVYEAPGDCWSGGVHGPCPSEPTTEPRSLLGLDVEKRGCRPSQKG